MVARNALLLIALALAGGCTSVHYEMLLPEASLPVYAELGAVADALPRDHGTVVVGEVSGEPVEVAFSHTRGEDDEWLVVFLHGAMADCRTWRYVVGALGPAHDLLLVDFVGCGESDKPDPDDLPPDAYCPDALARQALLVIRARARDGQRIAVVGHSLGSIVILRMLGSPVLREEVPEEIARIERAVLLSPIDFAIGGKQPAFERFAKLTDLEVTLASLFGMVEDVMVKNLYEGAGDPAHLPREAAKQGVDLVEDDDRREAAQAMLKQAIPFHQETETLDWDRIAELVAEYRNVTVPCLLIPGARDATFPCAMAYKQRAQLPSAWLHVLPGCGHAIPPEAPREVAALIHSFMRDGGEGLPRVTDGVVDDAVPSLDGADWTIRGMSPVAVKVAAPTTYDSNGRKGGN